RGNEPVEPLRFRGDDAAAERSQLVIAATRIIELRNRPSFGFLNQTVVDQLRDGAVERPWPDVPVRSARSEIFLDAVRVALRLEERQQYQEMERLERKPVVRSGHTVSVTILPIR